MNDSKQMRKDIYAGINTKRTAVQCDVEIRSVAPFFTGIALIVFFAALILVTDALQGIFTGFAIDLDNAFGAQTFFRVDVCTKTVGILEDMTGTPAHDDAGALLCKLQNGFFLCDPQCSLQVDVLPCLICSVRKQFSFCAVLVQFCNHIFGKTAFFGKQLNQFLIIAWDTKDRSNLFTNRSATTSELATDRKDSIVQDKHLDSCLL